MRGSDFAELRVFATVAQQRSFSRAARALGMSSSSVSQVVRALENRVGLQLLNRTTRSVTPTLPGARLLSRLGPVLLELEAMVEDLGELRDSPSGRVRLLTPRVAFVDIVQPLLGPFSRAYPDIVLDVTVDDSTIDIVSAGFDVGIRLRDRLDADVVGFPVGGRWRQLPFASPSYLQKFGTPVHPGELHTHRCINWRQQGASHLSRWDFEKDGESVSIAVDGPLIVNDQKLAVEAALQGVGIALGIEHRTQHLVDEGRLVPLFDEWCPSLPGFFAYFPQQKNMPLALRIFIDFLRDQVRSAADRVG